jgi:isoprenylcysteine carboxyl methyltransferase (ICMT) family protein YpbQ
MKKHYHRLIAHLATYTMLKKTFYVVLIVWGVFALVTPFTPASWLAIVGLIGLLGRDRARALVLGWIGETWYARLHLGTFFEDKKDTVRDI